MKPEIDTILLLLYDELFNKVENYNSIRISRLQKPNYSIIISKYNQINRDYIVALKIENNNIIIKRSTSSYVIPTMIIPLSDPQAIQKTINHINQDE